MRGEHRIGSRFSIANYSLLTRLASVAMPLTGWLDAEVFERADKVGANHRNLSSAADTAGLTIRAFKKLNSDGIVVVFCNYKVAGRRQRQLGYMHCCVGRLGAEWCLGSEPRQCKCLSELSREAMSRRIVLEDERGPICFRLMLLTYSRQSTWD